MLKSGLVTQAKVPSNGESMERIMRSTGSSENKWYYGFANGRITWELPLVPAMCIDGRIAKVGDDSSHSEPPGHPVADDHGDRKVDDDLREVVWRRDPLEPAATRQGVARVTVTPQRGQSDVAGILLVTRPQENKNRASVASVLTARYG